MPQKETQCGEWRPTETPASKNVSMTALVSASEARFKASSSMFWLTFPSPPSWSLGGSSWSLVVELTEQASCFFPFGFLPWPFRSLFLRVLVSFFSFFSFLPVLLDPVAGGKASSSSSSLPLQIPRLVCSESGNSFFCFFFAAVFFGSWSF